MKQRRCRPEGNSRRQSVSVARKLFLICSFAALFLPILEASLVAAELPNVACSPLLAANGIYHPWQSSYHVSSWHAQELEYADCRPQKMLYEVGAIHLTDPKARRKIKQSLSGIIRGLALLLCYGMSFVYCSLFLTTLCTNISSEFDRDTKVVHLSEFHSFNEIKKELLVTALFFLIMLQYYWIDCALQRAHTCTGSYKYCAAVYDHHVCKAITICPLSVLSMKLLLSGDVETNPGPQRKSHRRTNSLELRSDFVCDYIGIASGDVETTPGPVNGQRKSHRRANSLDLSIDLRSDFKKVVYLDHSICALELAVKKRTKKTLQCSTDPCVMLLPEKSKKRTKNAVVTFRTVLLELSKSKKLLRTVFSTANCKQVENQHYYQLSIYIKTNEIVETFCKMLKEAYFQNKKFLNLTEPRIDDAINRSDPFQTLIHRYLEPDS